MNRTLEKSDISSAFFSSWFLFGIPYWKRKWQPTPVPLPGKSHGRRSPVGYSPWGRKELDMTERLHFTSLPSTYLLSSYLGDVKHLIFIVVNRIGILGVLLSSDPSIPSKLGPKLNVIKTQFNWKLTEAYNSPLKALLHAFIWGRGRSMWGCELWCCLSVGPCVFLSASCTFHSYSHKPQWLRRGLT